MSMLDFKPNVMCFMHIYKLVLNIHL